MKIAKKAISVVLAIMIVVSAVAVTTISASAKTTYNPDMIYTFDSTLRDYSYGTGIGAHFPVQCSYNDTGWMRWQSKTAEEIANNELGTYSMQWQWYGYVTPEFQEQFHKGVSNVMSDTGSGSFAIAVYIASANTANVHTQYTSIGCEVQITFSVDCTTDDGKVVRETISTMPRATASELKVIKLDPGKIVEYPYISYKLVSVGINLQDYTYQGGGYNNDGKAGLGNLDAYISPAYATGSEMPAMGDASDYTEKFNSDDWTFSKPKGEGVGAFDMDDIARQEETNYPQKADGTYYTPIPANAVVENVKPSKITGVKTSVSGTTAKVTWNAEENSSKYNVVEANGLTAAKTVTGTSATFTGLVPGKTYSFKVRGQNDINQFGAYSDVVTAKIAGGLTVSGVTTVKAGKTTTLKGSEKVVSWATSNKAIATVSGGVVKGIKKGTVKITATSASGVKVTKTVSVKSSITKIKLNKTKVSLKKGKTLTLKATVTPTYAKKLVGWKTSKSKIVKVTNGKIKALKKGTAVITCYAKDGSGKKATCKVTVK